MPSLADADKPENNVVVLDENTLAAPQLKILGGSNSDEWNQSLVNQALSSIWLKDLDAGTRQERFRAVTFALRGIAPKDEIESMLAAQLIASHNLAMDCYGRAMVASQSFEGRQMNLNHASKLSRSHAALLEALNRHRGKSNQKVTVEHVHVHSGGQAVVGSVTPCAIPGGGDHPVFEEQPHAKQNGHAH